MTQAYPKSIRTTRSLTRRAFAAGLAASGAAALAACGASDEGKTQAADATGGAAEGEATEAGARPLANQTLTPVTFCLDYTPNTNHTGIYVALHEGWFAEEGIDLEVVQPAEDSAEAMIGTNQAQLGVSYQDYIANVLAADAPLPVVAVAAVIQHNTSGIMSPAELGVTRPAAMEGKRYATWELPVELATVADVVEADGGDFSKVELVPYTVDDEVAGFAADLFDTVWVFEGWAVQNAHVQDVDVNYFSFISVDDVFDFYTPVIAANGDWASAHADTVKAFLRAAKRGYEFAIAHPDEAADILLEEVPELSEDLVRASQAYLADQYQADAPRWGEIDPRRWARFYQWLNDQKLVEHELDPAAGFTMEYLDGLDA